MSIGAWLNLFDVPGHVATLNVKAFGDRDCVAASRKSDLTSQFFGTGWTGIANRKFVVLDAPLVVLSRGSPFRFHVGLLDLNVDGALGLESSS